MSDQESVEKKSEFFDLEKIKQLPRYELKQVLNFLDPLHDEEKYVECLTLPVAEAMVHTNALPQVYINFNTFTERSVPTLIILAIH